jgi:methylmalonyl-CoA mutase
MTDAEELAFATEFPAATREQWLKLVDAVLKGAPFDKRLVAKTYDGLPIQPLYPRDAGAAGRGARAGRAWAVMQRVDHPDPAAANEQALHDLENGATGLTLVCRARSMRTATGSTLARDARARARRRLSRCRRRDRLQRRAETATPRRISPRW